MKKENEIKIFEDKKVRTLWVVEQEKWYFSIVDVIAILTESPNPRKYWSAIMAQLGWRSSYVPRIQQVRIARLPHNPLVIV